MGTRILPDISNILALVDTGVSIEAGIPGYDEHACIQYAGGLSEGTPEELAE